MKILIKYFVLSVIAINVHSSAIIIYGDDPNEDCQKHAFKLINKYTGATASAFLDKLKKINDHKYASLFESSPTAETDFIQNKLNTKFPSNKLTFMAIPTTVWDISVISAYMNSSIMPRNLFESFKNLGGTIPLNLRIEIFNFIASSLRELSQVESDDLGICRAFIVDRLESIENENLGSEWAPWTEPLLGELQRLKQGKSSILMRTCEEELKALNLNKIFVVRATAGCKFQPKPRNVYASTTSKSKLPLKKDASIHYDGRILKPADILLDDIIPNDIIPNGSSYNSGKILTEQRLDGKKIDPTSELLSTKNLSFSSSILAGFFFDGPTKSKSACTYIYSLDPKMYIYSLQLDKRWFYSGGKGMFHFCKSVATTDAVVNYGEGFHPRVRSLHRTKATNGFVSESNQKIYHNTIYPKFFPDDKDAWKALSRRISSDDIVATESRIMARYIIDFLDVMQKAQILSLPNHKIIQEHNSQAQGIVDNYKIYKKKFIKNLK